MSQDGSNFFHQSASADRYFRGGERRRSPNTTPASTVLNSPDLTIEASYLHHSPHGMLHHGGSSGNHHHHHHHHHSHPPHQIKVGRSPVSQHNTDSGTSGSPVDDDDGGSPMSARGAVGNILDKETLMTSSNSQVIFDDIGDSWRKYPCLGDDKSERYYEKGKGTKIIEYDGSPRRFGGNHQFDSRPPSKILLTSPTLLLPKPGFPQRITSNVGDQRIVRPLAQRSPTTTSHDDSHSEQPSTFVTTATDHPLSTTSMKTGPFDYLYEFSETRKVLEDFFKSPDDESTSHIDFTTDSETGYDRTTDNSYIGQRLSKMAAGNEYSDSPRTHYGYEQHQLGEYDNNEIELYLDSNSRSSGELADTELDQNLRGTARHYTLSPESMDYDSNCGDLDSLSNDVHGGRGGSGGAGTDYARLYTSMPILEDGLSSGHASDTENNNPNLTVLPLEMGNEEKQEAAVVPVSSSDDDLRRERQRKTETTTENSNALNDPEMDGIYSSQRGIGGDVEATLRDIRTTLQRTKTLLGTSEAIKTLDGVDRDKSSSPIWIPRNLNASQESVNSDNPSKPLSHDEEEADTDLETDRLLGQQRLDEQDDKANWCDKNASNRATTTATTLSGTPLAVPTQFSSATIRHGVGTALTPLSSPHAAAGVAVAVAGSGAAQIDGSSTTVATTEKSSPNKKSPSAGSAQSKDDDKKELTRNKEGRWKPSVLIEGVLFRARYLGSTQLVCEGQPTKSTRMIQAEEAVSRIKAPEGESQPSTEVDLFISTEKIMVLNTDLKEIMMDHALRTISYIADIGDLVVLMARRRFIPQENEDAPKPNRTPKMICHVFESDEAQFIAQSIGQAFQVAYMEFLKANGIEDHSFVKEMDYQEVLNSQEIFGDELEIFAKKELQKEVVVPKVKGEILGVVIVESGWGSMLPTVVIANLLSTGAAARCGQLNIGDQIIAINGLSLVGLPLSTCQSYIRNTKTQTAVKFTVVPCPPVVEVKIKRPNTKYQLGFSVQNGVICSLLRGGIAERGGVRVGHRIIEINNQSVVAVPHEKIVSLLATSVGEILMKTMPTSMFRLLTGQENPLYI